MSYVYFISHPEVEIDKNIPVPQWGLSEKGLARLEKMLEQPWIQGIGKVFSSNENKAVIAANRIAEHVGAQVHRIEGLGEMDRSATGRLDPEEFELVVNEAFANPDQSICGWERLADAQERIAQAVDEAIALSAAGENIAIVSHGGVGTLLICKLKGVPIARSEDQPGQGHYYVFDKQTKQLVHSWKKIDDIVIT